jgi:transcriptional regulator with XRE-family HTH domain
VKSAVQQARDNLGDRLRDIRKDARVSRRQLASLAGWHFTRVSRIEHGHLTPSGAEVALWCRHCGAESQITDLSAAAREIEQMFVEMKRLMRTGTTRYQQQHDGAVPDDFASGDRWAVELRPADAVVLSGWLRSLDWNQVPVRHKAEKQALTDLLTALETQVPVGGITQTQIDRARHEVSKYMD